jgi:hypothetical protein
VAAYQNVLQVYTKDSHPQPWAKTQNNLARAFGLQENWEEAVQAEENALTVDPTWIEALARAEWIYHERLFRFDRAFELGAMRIKLGDGELDFVEEHMTTARFDICATRAAVLQDKISEKDQRLMLTALRFACLAGAQKTEDARTAGRELRKGMVGLEKVRGTFSGDKHFVSQHFAFAVKAAEWVRLFEALEQGDEAKALASLAALGAPE